MTRSRILLFVEDPGAANYALGLPEALGRLGIDCALAAHGTAVEYLRARGVEPHRLEGDAGAVMEGFRPGLLAVGTAENPRTMGLRLVAEARRLGVPSVGLVDSATNAPFRFRGDGREPLAAAPDWLAVPDEATRAAYDSLGFPGARITICGHPHYDHVLCRAALMAKAGRERIRREALARDPGERPVAVFAAETSNGLDPGQYHRSGEYTLTGRGTSGRRTDIVLEEFLMAVEALDRRPYLVLRLHPKNAPDEFGSLAGAFDEISAGGDPLRLVYASDLLVGMTSMLLAEAALMGVPTLSIVPRAAERDWLPQAASGLRCVWTRPEIGQALSEMLARPASQPRPAGLVTGAADRVAAFLKDVLSGAARHA